MMDRELLAAAQRGDQEACGRLIEENTGLIWSIVRRYYGRGAEPEDLYQLGCVGVLKAIRGFDPGRAASFRPYAQICIRSRLRTAVRAAQGGKHAPLNQSISYEPPLFDAANARLVLSAESPEDVVIGREELRERLAALRSQLSELEGQILTLYLSGLSCAEIAKRAGRSKKSVDNAIQRIRRKMARGDSSGESSES